MLALASLITAAGGAAAVAVVASGFFLPTFLFSAAVFFSLVEPLSSSLLLADDEITEEAVEDADEERIEFEDEFDEGSDEEVVSVTRFDGLRRDGDLAEDVVEEEDDEDNLDLSGAMPLLPLAGTTGGVSADLEDVFLARVVAISVDCDDEAVDIIDDEEDDVNLLFFSSFSAVFCGELALFLGGRATDALSLVSVSTTAFHSCSLCLLTLSAASGVLTCCSEFFSSFFFCSFS